MAWSMCIFFLLVNVKYLIIKKYVFTISKMYNLFTYEKFLFFCSTLLVAGVGVGGIMQIGLELWNSMISFIHTSVFPKF